jgi:TP53 regulating kinase and related kinases
MEKAMLQIGDTFSTKQGNGKILSYLGRGKSGYSYLFERGDEKTVLKIMHHDPVAYYNFEADKLSCEINAYKQLKELGLAIPELYEYDIEREYLVKQFIEGYTGAELIAQNKVTPHIIRQLLSFARKLRQNNLNVDFFPTNFVIRNDQLFYIDYEINPYMPEWNLENWGIYYWANSAGMREFLATGDPYAINAEPDKGLPVKTPFEAQVRNWLALN